MEMNVRLEGTAEEIGNALKALQPTGALYTTALELHSHVTRAEAEPEFSDAEEAFVSTEFAKRALKRLPISKPMKEVLKNLYKKGKRSLSTKELHDVAGYTPPQFAGLMGAFGRRLANTKGYDSNRQFFDWRWNEDKNTWDCRLPESVRKALEESFPNTFPKQDPEDGPVESLDA